MDKQPRNIFEQILFGLEATNANVVALSEEIAMIRKDLDALKSALYMNDSEPNALGAVNNETVEGTNNQVL